MDIKILGSGCKSCHKLEANTKEALANLDIIVEIEKVTDFKDIMAYGVMKTPALVVDGKVITTGYVAKTKEIVKLLKKV